MLDILVIAPHPDDAELGMGGALVRFKSQGLKVGVLDLTSGEPTPHGSPELRAKETAAATAILQLDWRENLGLPNRSLQPTLEAAIGRGVSASAADDDFFAILDRRASRPRGGDRANRSGAVLVEANEDRHGGRAVSSATDSLLLVRPLAINRCGAGVRARYQRAVGAEASGGRVLHEPVYHRAPNRAADVYRSCA
jgi:GlcNAc-PI de-N-acetylase